MQVNRRLYRCRENRVLAGVASGVAEYFNLDPTLVRILWFLSIFVWGAGILVYIGLAIIVPLEPVGTVEPAGTAGEDAAAATYPAHQHAAGPLEGHRHERRGSGRLSLYLGIGLMMIGGLALIDVVLPGWASWRQLWPLLLVGFGGVLILGSLRRERESTDL
jgi:phage shock protein C